MREYEPVGEYEIRRRHIFFSIDGDPPSDGEHVIVRCSRSFALEVEVWDVDPSGEVSASVIGAHSKRYYLNHGKKRPIDVEIPYHTPIDPRSETIARD